MEEKEMILENDFCAIKMVMMPKDTNQYGTIFGGVILSLIDQAAFVEVRKLAPHTWVTAKFTTVDFLNPVRVGDIISIYTKINKTGTKSATVDVKVFVERFDTQAIDFVTEAQVVMVSVNSEGKSIPFSEKPEIKV